MLANVIQNLYEMWVYSYPREIYAIVVLHFIYQEKCTDITT
jgi:hypothetical protein